MSGQWKDVDALTRLLMAPDDNPFGVKFRETVKAAHRVLESDWLAERDALMRREGATEPTP